MKGSSRLWCIAILTVLCTALIPAVASAQAEPSAFGPGKSLWVGAQYSNFSASFPYQSGQRTSGFGAFVDAHLNYRFTLEGQASFLMMGGYQGSTQSSFLAGPKVFFLPRGNLRPFGKLLVGQARIHYPYAIGDASYLALAPGAGAEYHLTRRWLLKGEYEYQLWLNSPGYASVANHELTPNGVHIGIAYRVFRY